MAKHGAACACNTRTLAGNQDRWLSIEWEAYRLTTEHREEGLADNECEEEVDGNVDGLAGRPGVERLNLNRDQPTQGTPVDRGR